jgi:hypothetical protein
MLLAKGADVQATNNVSIKRAFAQRRPLTISLTHAHAECALLPLGDVTVYLSCCLSRRRFGSKA